MASQIPDPENSALSIAINNVSHERLRSLFIAICEKVPEAREQAQTALLIETNSVGNPTEKERSRYSNCENCEKEFDTLGNTEKSCRYHPEDSEAVEERFVDQPDWIDIDTEENRECFPQNFEFQCCNDTLKDNPLGCVVGFHVKINRDSGKNGSGNADSLAAGEQKKVEPSVSDGMKGMVSRYAHCRNCKDEYDTTENSKQSCRYHPQRSEPTEEMYVDNYDEFEVDNDEMREDFPEHFEFQCCNDTLKDNPKGCVVGFHIDVNGSNEVSSGKTTVQTETKPTPSEGTKRMISQYAQCKNCEEEFDTAANSEKLCRYHPESPEEIEDAFADMDSWMEIQDEEASREAFPHCYQFPCCEETMEDNPRGCFVDFHVQFVEDGSSREAKRARVC